jgi:photosystem II stability/assembly factor-like uncharacterized protein
MSAADGWEDVTLISRIDARIYDLALDTRGTLWAAGKTKGAGHGQLHYSEDGGVTWTPRIIGNTTNNVLALTSIVFSTPDAAVVSGSYGTALRMQYAMGEWFVTPLDAASLLYRQLQGSAASGPMHVWITSTGGTIFESVDLGGTWDTVMPTSSNLWDIAFSGPDRGIAVGDGLVCWTDDGGTTWNTTTVGADLLTVSMRDSLRAVASGGGGEIWETFDGGSSWAVVNFDCEREEDIRKTVLAGADTVWAVGRNLPLRLELGNGVTGCSQWALADTIRGENIIFSIEGESLPDERVVISAHYDSRNWSNPYCAPGADDNASGCSGVLEIARVFSDAGFERSIDFILFDGEETGLIGSRYYVAERDTDEVIHAVINIDMIGRDYGSGDGITVNIAGREDALDSSLAELMTGMSSFLNLDLNPKYMYSSSPTSDHKAFWEIDGVPAVLLIENEYRSNPHYHACTDIADNMDFDFVTDIVKMAAGSAAELAGLRRTDPLPSNVVLYQNFPNPIFNHTRIRFELPSRMDVDLTLFDVTGRKVVLLIRDDLGEGRHEYAWDGRKGNGSAVESGVYFLRLKAGGSELVRKVVIVR